MKAMNVNIVGGKYYGAVLLIAESGTLYCVALVRKNSFLYSTMTDAP